ncbi:MAG: metal-dependent phosphohydrolase [Desulfobulbus propionicus]|nr:MAG: metal-dependent phosphohydrolase [Desulfobulbus propionicus]
MKKYYISQLTEGQQVDDLFLVSRKRLMETRNGKPYLALTLMDSSGEVEARVWENAAALEALAEVGRVVRVQAQAKCYREQLQLGVSGLEPVPAEAVQLEQFMPASARPVDEMEQELTEHIARLTDASLKQLLQTLFQGKVLQAFLRAPAAKRMHHAYIGGLAEHSLSLCSLAVRVTEQYPALDQDLLLAACLVHDLAKIVEFDYAVPPFEYTDQGRLLGHIVLGTEMVRTAAREVKALSAERLDALCHIILSHHGKLEFGSPVLPMTPEAMIFHHLDDMDAKMNYLERLAAELPSPGPGWTEYQRPLERFLYLRRASEESPNTEPAESAPRPSSGQDKQLRRQQSLF